MINKLIITDNELLLRVRKNDLDALTLLYNRYSPLLYTLINRILKNEETSSKILIECFLIIWRWAEEFDFEVYNVYTWMVLLARNKAIDNLKRIRADKDMPEYKDEYEIINILPKLSYDIEAVEFEHILKLGDNLYEILNDLNENQKKLFELAYFECLNEDTIAEKMQIPVATVKPQLQNVMEILMNKIIR